MSPRVSSSTTKAWVRRVKKGQRTNLLPNGSYPDRFHILRIALNEAVLNAIQHGNLRHEFEEFRRQALTHLDALHNLAVVFTDLDE